MKISKTLKSILLIGIVILLTAFQTNEKVYFYKDHIIKIYYYDYDIVSEIKFPKGNLETLNYLIRVFEGKKNILGSENFTDNKNKLEEYNKKYLNKALLQNKGKNDIEISKDLLKILYEKKGNRIIYYYLKSGQSKQEKINAACITNDEPKVGKMYISHDTDLLIEITVNGKIVYSKKHFFKSNDIIDE
jgi:hypothetical protein